MRDIRQQTSENPKSRNWFWLVVQKLLQIFFLIWFRFRCFNKERVENLDGALLLINHQSFLDPLLVGATFNRPVSFLARDTLFKSPFIGWVLRNTYVMPVNREAASTASIRESVRRIQLGYLVGLFPEGTRSEDGVMGEVRPGFISIVRRIRQPIVPVGVAGAFDAYPRKAKFIWPTTIRVVYGEPIPYEEYSPMLEKGRELDFTEYVKMKIQKCYAEAEKRR
jgi:1-acyl-sn-glycerol-3-phosphate acyltransferase